MSEGTSVWNVFTQALISLAIGLVIAAIRHWIKRAKSKVLIPFGAGVALLSFVIIFLARPESLVEVPDLNSRSRDEAEELLMKTGLIPRTVSQSSQEIQPWRVIPHSQDPPSGIKVRKGTEVKFAVAFRAPATPERTTLIGPDPPKPICLLDQEEAQTDLKMAPIPVGEYRIDAEAYLVPYLRSLGESVIRVDKPFSMQIGEVTVGEFRRYVESLDDAEREGLGLGADWEQDQRGRKYPDNHPASSILWKAAQGYARWISQKTSCTLQLPTRREWAAAVIRYATSQSRKPGEAPQLIDNSRSEPDYLVGNLREWSRDLCPHGHFVLGEDHRTNPEDIGRDLFSRDPCAHDEWALRSIGFRLVKLGGASSPLARRGER